MHSCTYSKYRFEPNFSLEKRIELVRSIQKELGYVSRKILISTLGVTQLQAGALMRDFIHAYAKHLHWDMNHAHYIMKS